MGNIVIRYYIAYGLGILLAIDVHEFFHAWIADRMGDPTARYMGRISLNPIVHLDPLGTIVMIMAMISHQGFGWGKPVPVNPRNLRHGPRVGMGLVAFAGPLANLVTAAIIGAPIRLGLHLPGTLADLLWIVALTNISLAVFNLIPLPPLDGYSVLQGILASTRGAWSYHLSESLTPLEQQGPFILLILILVGSRWGLLQLLLGPPVLFLSRLLLGG